MEEAAEDWVEEGEFVAGLDVAGDDDEEGEGEVGSEGVWDEDGAPAADAEAGMEDEGDAGRAAEVC